MILRELYRLHDEAWESLMQTSNEERRAAFDSGYKGDSAACVAHREMLAISEKIAGHPDERDFEADLRETLGAKICSSDSKAREVYSALCNVRWEHENGSRFSCSWRSAGGIIAETRHRGDYMDWYCSGREGTITSEISDALASKGWRVKETETE